MQKILENQEALAAEQTQGSRSAGSGHTPTPWTVSSDPRWINRENGMPIVMACGHRVVSEAEGEANAAFIVCAVNAHDDMLAALRTCRCPGGGWNGMPADVEPTVENCMAAKACGCDCGAAVAKATGAQT